MNTDSFESWLSSKLFDAETAALVAICAAIIIKQIGYIGTLFSTVTAMFYSLRGGYRAVAKWKARRIERAATARTAMVAEIAAEVAKLTGPKINTWPKAS